MFIENEARGSRILYSLKYPRRLPSVDETTIVIYSGCLNEKGPIEGSLDDGELKVRQLTIAGAATVHSRFIRFQ
jgi:hypothetical protein